MNITEQIKSLMHLNGVTWKDVSSELKIGRNQLKYWEDNDSLPDGKTLLKLATYFNVSLDSLLGIEDKQRALQEQALAILDEPTEQEKALLTMFRATSEEGRLRIIQAVMNIYDEVK